MLEVWNFPTRTLFGEDAAEHIGAEAIRLGAHRALLISDKSVMAAGAGESVQASLEAQGVTTSVFSDVHCNPLEADVHQSIKAFRAMDADLVVAVGGGSAIDVAKLTRLAVLERWPLSPSLSPQTQSQSPSQSLSKTDLESPNVHVNLDINTGTNTDHHTHLPPMFALPTTAGTGSEVTATAVATLAMTGQKASVQHPALRPTVAILDPVLLKNLPSRMTAASGMLALSQCIEAYCAKGDHPMADAIALKGLSLVPNALERSVQDGSDLDAHGVMLKAAMMSGVASEKGFGACRALADALSVACNVPCGIAHALCLPAVLDFNRTTVPRKIAEIARILGVRGDDDDTLAFECAGAMRALRKRIGLPCGLEAVGANEETIVELAAKAMTSHAHNTNPRVCTREEMLRLYQASM